MEDARQAAGADAPVATPCEDAADDDLLMGFTRDLGRSICLRVASGETLVAICAEAGMPSRKRLWDWTQAMPRFREELARAKTAGGRATHGGYPSSYCAETAEEFFHRLCEGESILAICRDPAMPSFSTYYYWRRKFPEFRELMEQAREVQAERLCAEGLEIARAVTPETAHATRVMLSQFRWTCGVTWPQRFRTRAAEPETPPEVQSYLFKHYQLQVREDGAQRVVASSPDPETGLPVWVFRGPWASPMGPDEAREYARRAEGALARPGQRVLAIDDPAAEVTHEERQSLMRADRTPPAD